MDVLLDVLAVVQPAALGDVVAEGATEGIEFGGVLYGLEELGDDEAEGSLLDVLTVSPPAEIVDLFDIAIGTGEERNVGLHPGECLGIRNDVDDLFLHHAVELLDMRGDGFGVQEEGAGRREEGLEEGAGGELEEGMAGKQGVGGGGWGWGISGGPGAGGRGPGISGSLRLRH